MGKIPEGYVLVPKEAYDILVREAAFATPVRHPVQWLGDHEHLPLCGCKPGTACCNAACPYGLTVTC